MSGKPPRNVAASVRQRLLDHARKQGEDFQYVLTQYGLERLLYRLSQSRQARTLVLKGAVLFQLWSGTRHRPTRDLDLLGQGDPSPDRFVEVFQEICSIPAEDDGLLFDVRRIRAEPIKEEDEYQGIRLRIDCHLGNARIPLQIDVGFGDAITPGTVEIVYPTLLDQPAPSLKAYPRETVVAEKYQAMVMLGMANSRMKDFFDLWTLALQFDFSGPTICQAIQATFDRRQTSLPRTRPVALTEEFANDRDKSKQWQAFLRKGRLTDEQPSLSEIVELLNTFLMPPTKALIEGDRLDRQWRPGGPWS